MQSSALSRTCLECQVTVAVLLASLLPVLQAVDVIPGVDAGAYLLANHQVRLARNWLARVEGHPKAWDSDLFHFVQCVPEPDSVPNKL